MNNAYNCITIDNPNIEVGKAPEPGFGQFITTPIIENNLIDKKAAYLKSVDLYLPDFSMRMYEGNAGHDIQLVNQHNMGSDLLGSCLFLKGTVRSYIKQQPNVEGYAGSQNFKFDPANEFRHVLRANVPFHIVHFSYTADYIRQFLPENEAWSQILKEKIFRNERIIGEKSTPITQAQDRALQNILNCPLTGYAGQMIMETSFIQIILLQLHALFNKCPFRQASDSLGKRDAEVMYGVKEHLTNTFLEDHSLQSLARHFGTNTNKLMALFRKMFGKSIFEYIFELRMGHAHMLLLDKGMMVTEVSRVVGYKNPNHFSVAFKKRFGFCPSEIR